MVTGARFRGRALLAVGALALAGCSTGSGGSGGTAGVAGIPGTGCASPLPIAGGGSIAGNTCNGGATVSVTGCMTNTAATVFEVLPTTVGQSRALHVTSGFTLAGSRADTCNFDVMQCDAGGIEGIGASAGAISYLAVFRDDGTCGPFQLDVYNASFCRDPVDAGSCMCGNVPACAAQQVCHVAPDSSGTCTP